MMCACLSTCMVVFFGIPCSEVCTFWYQLCLDSGICDLRSLITSEKPDMEPLLFTYVCVLGACYSARIDSRITLNYLLHSLLHSEGVFSECNMS
jgi:hypothetical protein